MIHVCAARVRRSRRPRRERSVLTRAVSIVIAGMLIAGTVTAIGAAAPAAAAAPLACLNTLYFTDAAASTVRQVTLSTGVVAPAPVFATPVTAGFLTNQLGIGVGGLTAIAGTSTNVVTYSPTASVPGTITVSTKAPGIGIGTMGAINPLNGLYYYGVGAGGTVSLYVHDPATGSSPAGPVVSVTVNDAGTNGDIAFDEAGNLYVVSATPTESVLYIANGVVPTSGTGTVLGSRELSRSATAFGTNGIAFGSDGYLYLGGPDSLQRTNPITGVSSGAPIPLAGVTSSDLASCANPSSARILGEFRGARIQPTDQVRVVLEGGSYGVNAAAPDFPGSTSALTGAGVPSAPGIIIPGETYTVRQEPVGSTNLGAYTTTWSCTDAAGSVISSGTGNTGTFTTPAGTDGVSIVCAFVNVIPAPVAIADAGATPFNTNITLPGATNDTPGRGAILVDQTVFTDLAAIDADKRLDTPDGVWTAGLDGRLTFTPVPGFTGDSSVEYRIIDADGQTSTATATATVRPGPAAVADTAATTQGTSVQIPVLGNDAPGQNADATAGTIPPASVLFEQAGQPAGAIVRGDRRSLGVPGEGVYTIDPATGVVTFAPESIFTDPTTSPVAYGFTDSLGNPATATVTVTVTAVPPTAVNDATATPFATPVTLDVVDNDLPGPGGAIVPTSTVFTDPAATDSGTALATSQGTWRVTPEGLVEFTPTDGFSGTASTSYRIADASGQQSSATVSVTVRPGPTATPEAATTEQNVEVSFLILGNDVPGEASDGSAGAFDPASLRFTVTPGLPAGSAVSGGGRVLTVPGEGAYTFDPVSEEVTFDPEPSFNGSATPITYRVTDSFGNDASATIAVTVAAVTPTAIGDAAKTAGSSPVVIDVLANDEPGAPSAPLVPGSVVFTSPEATGSGKTLVVPGEGTWTVRDDGSVRFAPATGFEGPTSPVTYSVSDDNGTRATAEIDVTVGSGAIAAPDAAVTRQNTPVVLDVLDNDLASDLGNPCDPGETNVPAGCDTGLFLPPSVAFPAAGQPAGAIVASDGSTVTVPGQGVYSADPTGRVAFTPEAAFAGVTAPVVYTAVDSNGATVSSTITVAVTGVTPLAQDDSATTPFAVPVTVDLLDDDSAGDASAPLVPAATIFPATGQPSGVTVSADGRTLTIDGQGTYVLDAAGSVVFTPADGFTGTTTSVAYRITDANSTTADARIQVTVRPGPSVSPDTASTLQGAPVTVRPFANDVPSRNADDSAGAWDLDTLRFPTAGQPGGAQVLDSGTRLVVPGEGTYSVAPDGSVTFTPLPAFRGVATAVSYTGADEIGNAATSTITIDVLAVGPSASDDAAITPYATPVTFDFAENDVPGDATVLLDPASAFFEASGIPAGLTAEIRDGGKTLDVIGEGVYLLRDDGTVRFSPAEGFSGSTTPVRYTISDENGTPARADVRVTVRPGPVASADTERTPRNVPVTVDILGNDRPGQLADGTDGELDRASVVFTATGQPAGAIVGAGGKTLEVPGEGGYEVGADGQVTFTPLASFRGAASDVAYAVTDSLGNTAASTITITVAGVDPIARNNTASTAPGVPVVIDVIGNDSSGTGGAALDPASLRIVGAAGALVSELTVPDEGVWTVVAGTIVFTPAPGFVGATTPITYSVSDATGTRVTATVTVTVTTAAAGASLPTTGGAVPWIPLGAGLLLLLAGIVVLIRRRSAR